MIYYLEITSLQEGENKVKNGGGNYEVPEGLESQHHILCVYKK